MKLSPLSIPIFPRHAGEWRKNSRKKNERERKKSWISKAVALLLCATTTLAGWLAFFSTLRWKKEGKWRQQLIRQNLYAETPQKKSCPLEAPRKKKSGRAKKIKLKEKRDGCVRAGSFSLSLSNTHTTVFSHFLADFEDDRDRGKRDWDVSITEKGLLPDFAMLIFLVFSLYLHFSKHVYRIFYINPSHLNQLLNPSSIGINRSV